MRPAVVLLLLGCLIGSQEVYGQGWMDQHQPMINNMHQMHNKLHFYPNQPNFNANENFHHSQSHSGGNGDFQHSESHSGQPNNNGYNAISNSFAFGTTATGIPYRIDNTKYLNGDTLYNKDRFYNFKAKTYREVTYTLDLTDPNAEPVFVKK